MTRVTSIAPVSYIPPVISRAFPSIFTVSASVAVLVLFGCQKTEVPKTVLAQVDQSRLTLEELRETFPLEYEKVLSREQYLDFIQRWIDDEAVFQEALKRKLDQDPAIRKKLDRLRRKVLIEELLAREVGDEEFEPDEGSMTRYYEMHKDEFRRKEPEFSYAAIRLGSLKEALAVRAQTKNEDFLVLAARHSSEPAEEIPVFPFRKPSEIPACIFEALSEAKPGWISTPISCQDGVYIVKLLETLEAGSLFPFAEARPIISGQLAMGHKDKMREAKISHFKEGVALSFNSDLIPGQAAPLPQEQKPALEIPDAINPSPAPLPKVIPKPPVSLKSPKVHRKTRAPKASAVSPEPDPALETVPARVNGESSESVPTQGETHNAPNASDSAR